MYPSWIIFTHSRKCAPLRCCTPSCTILLYFLGRVDGHDGIFYRVRKGLLDVGILASRARHAATIGPCQWSGVVTRTASTSFRSRMRR